MNQEKYCEEWYADRWKRLAAIRASWEENAMRDTGWSKETAACCENSERIILRDLLESPKYRAAPEMLEALKNIEANLTGRDNQTERWESSLRYAKEAIAKAEGTHAKD